MQQAFPCPKCGAQVAIGQRACGSCGERFEYRCAICGAIAETATDFCTNCGGELYRQTHSTEPLSHKVIRPQTGIGKAEQEETTPHPLRKLGAYLSLVVIILGILALVYAIGAGPQGEPSNWFGGSFIFGGEAPPSTPPSTGVPEKPKPVFDSPHYTTDHVIATAKNFSPHCRVPTRRTG